VMSSTMPRAIETASWDRHPFPVKDVTNLNPLDMGDLTGLDLSTIRERHPVWYHQLEQNPYNTRYGSHDARRCFDRLIWIVSLFLSLSILSTLTSEFSSLHSFFSFTIKVSWW
jgi:Histidine phosphatase superfamily (branch 1)